MSATRLEENYECKIAVSQMEKSGLAYLPITTTIALASSLDADAPSCLS
ncbi:hypothetical protein SBA1_630060 [Candidatus Sulfotelmatobacter kueseliae]|uniref:Uncharacterized protein n=1 Tax=Candidatus Sulfotelmatobacter kueseliae TaxID=2042962 RepID=A0A2U3L2I5_9BACT|nr:hypothetical protein SBA1_630060 [Candidatus Sulfotelmatobacter kueseliae]